MPGPRKPRKPRKAKNQAIAEEKALLAGTLPPEDRREEERREDDRRAPEPEPVVEAEAPPAPPAPLAEPEAPVAVEAPESVVGRSGFTPVTEESPVPVVPQNDQLHIVKDRGDGTKVNALGQIID